MINERVLPVRCAGLSNETKNAYLLLGRQHYV